MVISAVNENINAVSYTHLCSLVIGTSARLRHLQSTLIEPRECAEKVCVHQGQVAIVFGRDVYKRQGLCLIMKFYVLFGGC